MVWTVFLLNLQRLRHNRIELLLLFVVPIAFFSIFALIFGKGVGGTTSSVKVVIVDRDESASCQRVAASLIENPGLRVMHSSETLPMNTAEARRLVRTGGVSPLRSN